MGIRVSENASTGDRGALIRARTKAPADFAPLADLTRSSLAPDCETTSTADPVSVTPRPSENTDGGSEVIGKPVSRITSYDKILAAASDDPRATV